MLFYWGCCEAVYSGGGGGRRGQVPALAQLGEKGRDRHTVARALEPGGLGVGCWVGPAGRVSAGTGASSVGLSTPQPHAPPHLVQPQGSPQLSRPFSFPPCHLPGPLFLSNVPRPGPIGPLLPRVPKHPGGLLCSSPDHLVPVPTTAPPSPRALGLSPLLQPGPQP